MTDIHCHILPGVDDGSGALSDSLEMARIAAASGISSIVATPHCNIPGLCKNYRSEKLISKFNELRDALERNLIPVDLYCGQEVFFTDDFEKHFEHGDFLTLNGSRYMLVELDFEISEEEAIKSIKRVASTGVVPVAAHPERYGFIVEQPDRAVQLCRAGALLQLNRSSIVGEFGQRIYSAAKYILDNGLADAVASDAHSQYSRIPDFSDVHEAICENWSYDYADILLKINPTKIIKNETV